MATTTTTSSSIPIQIKWGKELISLDVPTSILNSNINSSSKSNSIAVIEYLQDTIQSKTNVPKHRQKLMCSKPKNLWKGILKENDTSIDWSVLLLSSSTTTTTTTSGTHSTTAATVNVQFLLMGTADEALLLQLQPPTTKTIFLEDMKEEDIAAMADPAGLVNLGNTCYLNSVLQCLRVIPQFQSALTPPSLSSAAASAAVTPSTNTGSNFFIQTLQTTYSQLSKQTTPVQPILFVQATKMIFPQFAQLSPSSGHPMQQDAEEFYSSLLSYLSTNIHSGTTSSSNSNSSTMTTTNANPIDTIFGIQMKETITCDEFTDPFATTNSTDATTTTIMGEPPVVRYDTARKLVCNIQGGGIIPSTTTTTNTNVATTVTATVPSSAASSSNIPTNVTFINEGIQLGLTTKIVKHSELLQRDAIWTSQQRIMKLPQVLTIQFGRFYWKLTPDSADHTGVKCKIMKPVAFHNTLDVYEFCTQDLQAVILKSRQRQLALEEEILNAKLLGKDISPENAKMNDDAMVDTDTNANKKAKTAATAAVSTEDTDTAMEEAVDGGEDEEELRAALAMSMQEEETTSAATAATTTSTEIFGPGIPNDFLGYYELFAVVTHKGRDADGGHYMAWVKADHVDGIVGTDTTNTVVPTKNPSNSKTTTDNDNTVNEDWYVFDDDEVSPCKTEDVLKLKGGGDWHMSYLNFYRVMKK